MRNAALNIAYEVRIMLDACEESVIDRVLEIIDKEYADWKEWDSHPEAIFENIRTASLALKGEQDGD